MKRYHYVYRIDCIVDGCYYIGVHSTNNLNDGYFGSGSGLKASIKKHGIEAFTKTILSHHDSRDEAINEELRLLKGGVTDDPKSYNIAYDGVKINHQKKKSILKVLVDYYNIRKSNKKRLEAIKYRSEEIRYVFEFEPTKLGGFIERVRKQIRFVNNFHNQIFDEIMSIDMFNKLAESLTIMYNNVNNDKETKAHLKAMKQYEFFDYLRVNELSISEYNKRLSEKKSIIHA